MKFIWLRVEFGTSQVVTLCLSNFRSEMVDRILIRYCFLLFLHTKMLNLKFLLAPRLECLESWPMIIKALWLLSFWAHYLIEPRISKKKMCVYIDWKWSTKALQWKITKFKWYLNTMENNRIQVVTWVISFCYKSIISFSNIIHQLYRDW